MHKNKHLNHLTEGKLLIGR